MLMARLSSFSVGLTVRQQCVNSASTRADGWAGVGVDVGAVTLSGEVRFEQQEALLFTLSMF